MTHHKSRHSLYEKNSELYGLLKVSEGSLEHFLGKDGMDVSGNVAVIFSHITFSSDEFCFSLPQPGSHLGLQRNLSMRRVTSDCSSDNARLELSIIV